METTKKPKIKLTLTPGLLTPAQKAAGEKFWAKLINEAKKNAGQPVAAK